MAFFTDTLEMLERIEAQELPRRIALMETCSFIGEDGKKYIDGKKFFGNRFAEVKPCP